MIALLVASCAKHGARLERWRAWEARNEAALRRNDIETLYVVGHSTANGLGPLSEWRNLHGLDVGDHYEDLPEKVLSGLALVREKWPTVEGVFKTDDDVDLFEKLLDYIRALSWIPYWALQAGHVLRPQVHERVYERSSRPLELKVLDKCIHALGRGYYVNRHCIDILTRDIEASKALSYHEDYLVGLLLNRELVYPVDFGFLLSPHYRMLE